ncbi:Crp/Fnr family transcriptional regulator [Labilibaculum sp. DW002]|uniref:Crp/Fnr family transcriptional regulator n=1 Tax=Paralabilibaculum antarcticum TaxID=2912572 RepID=A0ABT5VRY1_9BACT|nr:Crp/Fnr family transcriptional regulator [Labilibaculum sp. DW002]MDE5418191.1 Crp/Fnr family transcriptional regulator [Labilibaculum sp. DW002]
MNLEYQIERYQTDAELISAKDCFESLTPHQKDLVEKSTTRLQFTKGETIIKQGFVASHILYIEKGLAKLDVTNDSKLSTLKLLSNDSFVGIMCSFACKSLDFSAVALEDTTIRMINMDLFLSLVKENGEFALKLMRHMSSLTNDIMHRTSRIAGKNVEGSLALILTELSEIYKSPQFVLPVTRVGLASLAGCSKESVIHTLAKFHNDKIIEVKDKNITILKQASLELIIKNG